MVYLFSIQSGLLMTIIEKLLANILGKGEKMLVTRKFLFFPIIFFQSIRQKSSSDYLLLYAHAFTATGSKILACGKE